MAEVVSGVAALLAVLLYALIAWRMRTVHPQVWAKLGNPLALHDPTELGSLKLAEYIWKARWIGLHDSLVTVFCVIFYLSVVVMIIGFLGVAVA